MRISRAATAVVVLGDALWKRRFGADRHIVGRTVALDGEPFTVIGVMPPSFRFAPFWVTSASLWRPLSLTSRTGDGSGRSLRVFARLRGDVDREQAQAEASAIAARLAAAYPRSNARLGISVVPLREKVVSGIRPTLWLLSATVGLVLLIACVNVAGLQIVRGSARPKTGRACRARRPPQPPRVADARRKPAAQRGRWHPRRAARHVDRQMDWVGAASERPPGVRRPRAEQRRRGVCRKRDPARRDRRRLPPALQLSRASVRGTLQDVTRGATDGTRGRHLRRTLLALQLALALALLAGAGLMGRTLLRLQQVDPGFDPRNVLTFTLSLGGTLHDSAPVPYFDRVASAVAALPGVIAVSAINHLPLAGDTWRFRVQPEGRPEPRPGEEAGATWRVVRGGYFAAMRLPLRRGRELDGRDRADSLPVCIVNETMARRHWPGQDPVGRRVGVGSTDGSGSRSWA